MSSTHPGADAFFARPQRWLPEMARLRTIALGTALSEDLKWGQPCYTLGKANVVIIHGFKDYCALLFMKGALMDDPQHLLIRQSDNVQSARQIRFTAMEQIEALAPALKDYMANAIAVEQAGLKVAPRKNDDLVFPEEIQAGLSADPALKAAFDALTPGRRRAYHLHFSAPKQAGTRVARLEKAIPQIMAGKGWNER